MPATSIFRPQLLDSGTVFGGVALSFFKYFTFVLCISTLGLAFAEDAPIKKTPAEIIPVTESNLRGQQSLYREGWFVISSTEKAFSYAKEHAVTSSGQAVSLAIADASSHSKEFQGNLVDAGKGGVQTGVDVFKDGTELSKQLTDLTTSLVANEWDYGSSNLNQAWSRFVKGNMTLKQRTAEDRLALAALPGGWYKDIKSDFGNLQELTDNAKQVMSTNIEGRWNEAFSEARADFNESYQKSGTRGNSLSGLGDIIVGYLNVFYSGLVKPTSRAVVQGTEGAAKGAADVVFLPVAGFFVVSGRTIESTGLSLYYATSIGVELVSPTVEGGLLTGLSMLSYTAIPVTATGGYSA